MALLGQTGLTVTVEDGKWVKALGQAFISKWASIASSAKMIMFFVSVLCPTIVIVWFGRKTYNMAMAILEKSGTEIHITEAISSLYSSLFTAFGAYCTLIGAIFTAVIVVRGSHQISELAASTKIAIEENKNGEE